MKMLIVFAIALTSAFGQAGTTSDAPPSTSLEEMEKKLQERLDKMSRDAKEAEQRVANRSIEERKKIIEESKKAISAVQAELAAVKAELTETRKARENEAKARELEASKYREDQLRRDRNVWRLMIGLAGLLLIGTGIAIALLVRKKRSVETPSLGPATRPVSQADPDKKWVILTDPQQNVLKEMMKKLGVSEGLFEMNLYTGGPKVTLTAVLIPEKKNLQVRFPGQTELIDWKDKRDNRFVEKLKQQAS